MENNFVYKLIRWYKRPKSYFVDLIESFIVILPVVFIIKTCIFGLYQVPTCSMETTMLVGERFFADKCTPFFKKPQRGEIISFNDPNYHYATNPIVNWYQQYMSWNVVNLTKRVIAIPGDHIQGKIEDNVPVIYINGTLLHEPYLNKYPIVARYKSGDISYRSFDSSKPLNEQPFYDLTASEIARAKLYVGADHSVLYPNTPALSARHGHKDIYDVHLGANEYWMMGDNRQGSSDSRDWGPLNISKSVFHGRILLRIWSVDSDASWWFIDALQNPISFWKRVRWSRFLQPLH